MNSQEKFEQLKKTFKVFTRNNGIIISSQINEGNREFFPLNKQNEPLEVVQEENNNYFMELFNNSIKTELLGVFDGVEEPSYFIYESENESYSKIIEKITNNPFFQYSYVNIKNGKYSFIDYKKPTDNENKVTIKEYDLTIDNFLLEKPNGDYSKLLETGVYIKL